MLLEAPRLLPDDLPARLTRAAARLRGEPGLLAAVLFGSVARGQATPWSDVDIGLLTDKPWADDRLTDLSVDLAATFGRPVDVVDLRRAPLPLRGRAVQDARELVLCDERAWVDFAARTTFDWLDYRPRYEEAIETTLALVRAGR